MKELIGFRWEPCPGGARLLRVYGDSPCPVLPGTVAGLPVTEIGPYCFSEKERPGGLYCALGGTPDASAPPPDAHAVCGDFVTAVTLPDTVAVLHSAAFYNCRRLAELSVGAGISGLGSDLFTNCRSLAWFTLRCAPDAATGLRKLLGAVSADVGARFLGAGGRTLASLFYPEYFEWLDENTPAHIFNHSIEGEGYRYRQCFAGGVLDFAEYDAAFAQAAVGEPAAKLCRIALGRLLYPFALGEAAGRYRAYTAAHAPDAAALAVAERDSAMLRVVCELAQSCGAGPIAQIAALCSAAGWGEGAAIALAGGAKRRQAKRYSFDDL